MRQKCFLCAIVGHFDLQVSVHSSCKCPSVSSTWEWWMTGTFKAVHCQPLQDVSSLQTPGDHCAWPRNGLKVAQTNVSFLRPLHTGERFIHVINLQVYIFELLFLWFVLYTAKKRLFFLEGGRFVSAQRIKRHQPVTSQVITMADLKIVFVIVVYYMTKNATLWRRSDKDDFGWVTLIAAIYICRIHRRGAKAVISICAVFKSTRLLW